MDTQTLNLNSAQCLVIASDFGMTKITNVCTGVTTNVAWGSVDWTVAIGLTAGAILVTGLFASMIITVIRS